MTLRIGIDFDNTLASYDGVFYQAALEKGLIPADLPHSKGAVRDYLRSIGKEDTWTELQGYIYGARMVLAQPYSGADRFLALCQKKAIPAYIISHKTKHPFLGPRYDLHEAAKSWLTALPFSTPPAFFELTLKQKLERIALQQCTVFIDDLPELLAENEFPPQVKKILFDPHSLHAPHPSYFYAASWDQISEHLFAHGS